MKPIIIISILLFITLTVQGQISVRENPNDVRSSEYFKYRLDSISSYRFDKSSNSWKEGRTSSFLYNNNNQMILFAESFGFEQIYEYDDNGNLISIINHFKGFWDTEKQTYKYNESGQMIQTERFEKFDEGQPYYQEYKLEFSYNDKGYLDAEHTFTSFSPTNNLWGNHDKTVYSYNTHNDIIQKTDLKPHNDVWDTTDVQNYEYFYDDRNNITRKNFIHGILNRYKDYAYDQNNNQIQEKDWLGTSGKYLNYEINYTYDLSHEISDVIMPPLYIINDDTYNYNVYRADYYYFKLNSINNMLTQIHRIYDNGDEAKYTFHYSTQKVTAVKDVTENPITLFPNPCGEYTSINFDKKYKYAEFELFDVQGRKIMSQYVKNAQDLSLAGVNPGIYFYNLYFDQHVKNGKLIKK